VNVRFDQPELLLLALLSLPLIVLGWRWLANLDRLRRATVLLLRTTVIVSLAVILAGPRTIREHDNLTVIGVLDLSGSVKRFAQLPEDPQLQRPSNVEYLRHWFRQATATRTPDDRFGLVVFDGQATVISVPVTGDYIDDNLDVRVLEGTNIADGIRMALALFPADTGKRIVLVSDGNETAGDALEAAREAAAGYLAGATDAGARSVIPIDVAAINYRVSADVQVLRVESPPTAQPGQTVTVRIVLAATAPTRGRLTLRREGRAVDLNGRLAGTSRQVEVPAGRSVHLAQVELDDTPINRFEAIFEALDPGAEALLENNRAESFTATPSRGAVLVLDSRPQPSENLLAKALADADIPARAEQPQMLGEDLLSLHRYDLIVLDNVASWELSPLQQELLSRYVNDLGGGLIMVGGERSFGAGGWNGSPLEQVLPVELDPPRELKLASAALVLVLDKSGSMNEHVAGTRTTQQRIANEAAAMAIESLRSESLVGVVTFDFTARVHVPMQRNDQPQRIADRVRAINSDGGTNLAPALREAHRMLREVEAERKLVVCLSDGRSHVTALDGIVQAMVVDGITLTTIAVGDDADFETLMRLADVGNGEFHPVRNPRTLPRVLVDSVQVINKPLIKEVPFAPVVRATGSTLTIGLDAAPILDGLVITAAKPDPQVSVEMEHPDGEPLLAHWQAGLGRTAAFTSDADGRWSRLWIDWPGYATFWAQLTRTVARPATSPDAELITQIAEGRLVITLEAASDKQFLDYLHVDGTVYAPGGRSVPVRLRQTAPGRYETEIEASTPGNYVVALSPRRGNRRLAPVIGGASQSASPEFRRFRSNGALLDEIADMTGGRLLDVTRPQATDLFDRQGMVPSVAALPAWQMLLWLALGLLLLDIASRRLAWGYGRWWSLARQAAARVAPSHVRGGEAAATLASLREVSAEVDRKQASLGHVRQGGPAPSHPRSTRAVPQPTRPEPEPSKVAAAINVLLGKSAPAEQRDEDSEKEKEPEPETTGSTETTSGLLAAKRRARKKLDRDMGE
jgi:Mg-chelatase subunit ChlD